MDTYLVLYMDGTLDTITLNEEGYSKLVYQLQGSNTKILKALDDMFNLDQEHLPDYKSIYGAS